MSAIEEVLWNIFTFYSLNGNPKDPSRLHSMALLKLCKDIMALDQTMTECPITQADLHLIYTSVLRSPSKSRDAMADKSDKLNFDEFLSCILRIAQKCYPSALNQEESMQQLLMDNILPMAHRREPQSIATTVLKEPGIEHILKYYESSFQSIFKYFAAASDQLTKDRNMVRATQHIVKTFDEQVQQIQKANARCVQQNAVSKMMSYIDFIKFSSDLGLISCLPITIVEFGDIFLTVTSFANFSTSLRRIDFSEFCEALIRIALRAFQDLYYVSNEDKVKALLMNIWRYSQELLGAHMLDYGTLHGGGFNTAKEELLRSTETFTLKFKSAWAKDGYRNYLQPINIDNNSANAAGGGSSCSAPASPSPRKPLQHQHQHQHQHRSPNKSSTPAASSWGGASAANSPSPRKAVSLLQRLKGASTLSSPHGGDMGDIGDTMSVRSAQTGKSGTVAETISEMRTVKERLLSTLHERAEESENFVVTSTDGGQFRVMINDDDRFGDNGRISAVDLRKLFLHKPDLAAVMFDTMVEEGIVTQESQERGINEDDDGLEELGITMDDLALMQAHEEATPDAEAEEC